MTISLKRPPGVRLRWVLIRHGEPEASAKGRCYGKLDVGLSDIGRAQMARVSEAFRASAMTLDAVYTSPRRRAREGADLLSSESEISVDRRLSEIDFGALEGLTYEEAAEQFPHLYRSWMQEPTEVKFPGGESFAEMKVRVLEAVSIIRDMHSEQTIAIVSHGGVNRIVLAEALGIEARTIFHLDQSHAGVNIVDDFDDYSVVRLMNGTC
ncbi:MAG: alpha-ribazole phosphatase [Acidobacteriota bacterium]|nr:MAG: alpha-ribazole phosphatase [Acidobacteriota bacterium]